MTAKQVIAAIRKCHLRCHFDDAHPRRVGRPQWHKAWIDGGGEWIYLHVPCKGGTWGWDGTVQRVFPPARLRRQLARKWWPSSTAGEHSK